MYIRCAQFCTTRAACVCRAWNTSGGNEGGFGACDMCPAAGYREVYGKQEYDFRVYKELMWGEEAGRAPSCHNPEYLFVVKVQEQCTAA